MNRFLVSFFIVILALFAGCTQQQDKQAPAPAAVDTQVLAVTTVLTTIGNHEKPDAAAAPMGHAPTAPEDRLFEVIFSRSGKGVAYKAGKEGHAYVVHNGKAGKLYSAVGDLTLSDDGKRIAYGALVDGKWFMVVDGREGRHFNTVASPVFSPDGKHIAYQALLEEKSFIIVDDRLNRGSGGNYGRLEFSSDSSRIAYVENPASGASRLVIDDLEFKDQYILHGIGSFMITNAGKTRIAVVGVENGKQRVMEFGFKTPKEVQKGPLFDSVANIVFGPDDVSLAYEAVREGEHFLVFNGKEERISERPLVGPPVIRPDLKAVGAIIGNIDPATQHMTVTSKGNDASLHEFFAENTRKGKVYEETKYLVYSPDGSDYAHAARIGQNWHVVVNDWEGQAFDIVVTPQFSPDGKKVVYRARKDGKRFVVIADRNGRTIKQHPPYEQVFQPAFTADGKSVAYGVKDGNRLIWKVDAL